MYYWPILKSQLPKERLREMEEHSSIHSYFRKGDEETIFFTDATILRLKKGKEKIIPFSKSSFIRHFSAYVATAFRISKNSFKFLKRREGKPTSYDNLIKIAEEHGGITCAQPINPLGVEYSKFNMQCSDGKKMVYDETLGSCYVL